MNATQRQTRIDELISSHDPKTCSIDAKDWCAECDEYYALLKLQPELITKHIEVLNQRSIETDVGYDGDSDAILTIKTKRMIFSGQQTVDIIIMLGREHVQELIKLLVDHLGEMK